MRTFVETDQEAVIALWRACGLTRPWNDPASDIARKLREQPDGFLVGEADGEVIASAMFGFDGHRGWVNYLAVAQDYRGRGYGALIMEKGEAFLTARGCPKLNLQVRKGNDPALAFYARLGYVEDEVISLGKRLISDE